MLGQRSPLPAPAPPYPAVIVPPGKDATVLDPVLPGEAGLFELSNVLDPPPPITIGHGPGAIVCPVAVTYPPAPPPPPVLVPPAPPPPIQTYYTPLIDAGALKSPDDVKVWIVLSPKKLMAPPVAFACAVSSPI